MTLCQKDMPAETGGDEIYPCPYCNRPSFTSRIGRRNLKEHVKAAHPEKYKEFMMKKLGEYNMAKPKEDEEHKKKRLGRPPKEAEEEETTITVPTTEPSQQQTLGQQQQPQVQPQQVQQPIQPQFTPPQPILPTYQVEEPEKWLETFLRSYKFKELFIQIQVEQVRLSKELPYAGQLMQDVKTMESGISNLPTISFIVQMYERQVKQYMKKYEELMNTTSIRRGGYPMQDEYGGGYHDTYPSVPTRHGGMPIGRQQEYRRKDASFYETDRISRLEDELRRRDEEARRKMEYEYNNMRLKIEQGQTRQEDPALLRLQQQLETQASETRKLTAELSAQKENTLLERIARIEQHAGGPSAETIQRYIDQSIQAEHDKVTATDLDRKIKEAINASQGISTIDVEMKKIEKQYDIDQRKLEMEEKKGNMWGDTLKDVAGLVGEGIGKQMAGAEQPESQTQTPPVSCPHCGTPLMLPPGVKFGVCPKCSGKMEIGASGTPTPFTEPSIPQQKPPEPPPLESDREPEYAGTFNKSSAFNKPSEEPSQTLKPEPEELPLGICPKCGKPVYDSNIGKTEGGRPYHKECC